MITNESIKPSEIKYDITLDPRICSAKPNENEKKTITRYLTIQTGITINQFSQLVSAPCSHTWSGGLFNGLRSNKTWVKQSVFALACNRFTSPFLIKTK